MSYIVSLWYLCKRSLCWIGTPINIRSLIKWWLRFGVIDCSWFISAWNLYHICHITNSFYRRMMHGEGERPPNERSHAYHFCITYNGCVFAYWPLLQFLLSQNAYLKDGVWISLFHLPKILFSSLQLKLIGTAQRWAQKAAKHKKLLKLLCIVYLNDSTEHWFGGI